MLEWSGTASDGTEVKGKVTIPEVSHEITLDGLSDYVVSAPRSFVLIQLLNCSTPQYNWTLTTASSPAVDAIFTLAKTRLPVALETKFSEFPVALVDTHGKDLQISADPSRSGTPAPTTSTAPAASTSAVPAESKPVKKAEEKKSVNTTTVSVEGTFMATAEDIFALLTDEKRIPAWTRAPAQVSSSFILQSSSIDTANSASVDCSSRF